MDDEQLGNLFSRFKSRKGNGENDSRTTTTKLTGAEPRSGGASGAAICWAFQRPRKEKSMFDPDDYELHEAQKHACKMAKERDEARVAADRLTAELEKCAAVLPGAYYMDPPDGGDVSVSEQLRRMAKDAERYRYLRRKVAIAGAQFLVMNLPSPVYVAPDAAA